MHFFFLGNIVSAFLAPPNFPQCEFPLAIFLFHFRDIKEEILHEKVQGYSNDNLSVYNNHLSLILQNAEHYVLLSTVRVASIQEIIESSLDAYVTAVQCS